MEPLKEVTESTNGTSPDDVMRQISSLLQSLDYDGLGVVAIGPRTGSPSNPLDFLPEGWRLQIIPIKNGNL